MKQRLSLFAMTALNRLFRLGAGFTSLLLTTVSLTAGVAAGIPSSEAQALVAALGDGVSSSTRLTVDLPAMSSGAKKLEFVRVPGRGTVRTFLMGKYQVTQAQYQALMRTNPSAFKNGPDYPVEQVSWDDATNFCAKLNARLSEDFKSKLVFRLPADAEWSLAVGLPEESAGTPREKSGRLKDVYPWGKQWPPPPGAGNYLDESAKEKHKHWIQGYNDGFAETAPVGSFKPNRLGLHDLGGNVREWCEDLPYPGNNARVLRGSAWSSFGPTIASSYRDYTAPWIRKSAYGFRLVAGAAP